MQWVRNDISDVPPQAADVATQCPVRAQWDVLRPAAPVGPSELERRRSRAADATVTALVADLARRASDVVMVDPDAPPDARERCTLDAMSLGAPLVIGAHLPVDPTMRRTGGPDVLVADPTGGYHAVLVMHRPTLTDRRGIAGRSSTPDRPALAASAELDGRVARKSKSDLLALAHDRRMLEACGAAASTAWGGVMGSEGTVTWYDLDAPIWRTPSTSEGSKQRSTLDVYDFEFAFRLDIIAVARQHLDEPDTDLLVVPVRTGECARCPWRDHCRALMVERNDVSLLPYASWRMWRLHRSHGVHTVDDLAALDHRTASLLDARVDLAEVVSLVEGHDVARPLAEVLPEDPDRLDRLSAGGVTTVGDLRALDARVVAYSGAAPRDFAESIDLARARGADAPAHLRRGVRRIDVPRGDVEIDLDLENTDDGVYLWGALVTDRGDTGLVTEGYRSFATWEPAPSTTEVDVFERLASWLSGLRADVHAAGHTVTVYCYNERAEAGAMQRLASAPARQQWSEWVEELVGSDDWVDLYAVAVAHLITGAGMGLKHLANLAGFEWEDDDPGGLQSMQWHHVATTDPDPRIRETSRERILTYNRNDVEATLALRDWMEDRGPTLPGLESLEPVVSR